MHDTRRPTREILVDTSACAGHGLCYSTSPELIECDDQGYPVVLRELVTDDDVAAAKSAAIVCPERALTIESR